MVINNRRSSFGLAENTELFAQVANRDLDDTTRTGIIVPDSDVVKDAIKRKGELKKSKSAKKKKKTTHLRFASIHNQNVVTKKSVEETLKNRYEAAVKDRELEEGLEKDELKFADIEQKGINVIDKQNKKNNGLITFCRQMDEERAGRVLMDKAKVIGQTLGLCPVTFVKNAIETSPCCETKKTICRVIAEVIIQLWLGSNKKFVGQKRYSWDQVIGIYKITFEKTWPCDLLQQEKVKEIIHDNEFITVYNKDDDNDDNRSYELTEYCFRYMDKKMGY